MRLLLKNFFFITGRGCKSRLTVLNLIFNILFFFFTFSLQAQNFTNSWINYSQPYYKFPILQNGIYRITYDALVNSGIPAGVINPANIQMFGRGQELHIWVEGAQDGTFDPGDYVEFYAQRNDGYFDREVYDFPQNHGNPYYSLFNDTAYYFFSWGNTPGLRYDNITDTDTSGITPANFFFKENSVYFINGGYYYGKTYSLVNGSTSPQYTAGEGYFSSTFNLGGSFSSTINTPQVYQAGPPTIVQANVIGMSEWLSYNNHHIRMSVGSFSFDTVYPGFFVKRFKNQFPTSGNVSNGSTTVTFTSLNDLGAPSATNVVAYTSLRYPHTLTLPGGTTFYEKMFVPDNNLTGQDKSLLNFTNFNDQGSTGRLFDFTNKRRIALFQNGSYKSALIPDGGFEFYNECYLTSDAQIAANSIPLLKPCGTDQTGYFLDITNYVFPPNFYIITHKSLWFEAQNYKAYRNFSGYRAELFDVAELYDQFGHGIPKHPMAIRHFANYAYQNWYDDSLQHILLLGKAIYPQSCRTNLTNYNLNLVPTFGYPSCDMLFTAGLSGNLYEPAIPVGRIAARTPDKVQVYLDKIVEYEGAEPAEWKKRVLHFCGGADGNENELLCYYVDRFEETIEDSLYGAWVQKFSKTNSQPFQITQADSIRELIENGVSLMTFFGHGSGGGFDVNTDDVNTYNNEGKYPLIFGNSCLSGDIHNVPGSSLSMSEPWVLADNKGAIGFLASVGIGVTGALARYGDSLYSNLAYKNYHRTIGYVMKKTVADIQSPGNYLYNFTAMQNTLHGDPGIRINTHPLPDLAVKESNVYFTNPQACCTPITVTTEMDSFDVNIIVNNLGRTYDDTLSIFVRRTFPGGLNGGTVTKLFAPIYFKDTITVRFATNPIFGIGVNQLYVHVDDGPFEIQELSEQNNYINNMSFVVQSPDIIPVYPYRFAIMGHQNITLKASTGDPFAPSRTYRLQIDTTDRFNSPLLQQTTVTQSGGVVTWTPSLLANMPDSMVYFWRASLDSVTYPNNFRWRESSFQYIPEKYGWGQAHFFQFKPDGTVASGNPGYEGDKYNSILHNRPSRRFDFINTPKGLSLHNVGWPSDLDQAYTVLYKIDSEVQDYLACGGSNSCNYQWGATMIFQSQVIVAVINPNTLEPLETPGDFPVGSCNFVANQQNMFGQLNWNGSCGRTRPGKHFYWLQSSSTSMTALNNFLNNVNVNNSVPDSSYILIYSWLVNPVNVYGYPASGTFVPWPQDLRNTFVNLGFTGFDTIPLNRPWAFFCKKGRPSSAIIVVGDSPTSVIDLNAQMDGTWNQGTITTPLIGPSAGWNWMYWDRHPSEIPTDDTMNVKVTGVRFNGTEETVIPYFQIYPTNSPDSLEISSLIDHNEFPYIKLTAFTQDDTTRTPTQLDRWQIIYQQVPEAALNPNYHLTFLSPEVSQFQEILFSTSIDNISDYDMDSLLVKYWVQKANNDTVGIFYPRQKPLLVDDRLIDTITVPTGALVGANKLWVEANPYNAQGIPDQLEQYHFNNIGYVQFAVNGDRINPILDVTFDGIHILDGDIVSARPLIVMTINDENQYLLLNEQSDTANINVYIKKPSSQNYEQVKFNGFTTMQFFPASLPENKCRIEYPAVFEEDGIYTLRVQGKDKSNNVSGSFEYTITFEVINRSTITQVLNYPNPFSTSTRFVFVLTGSVIPDYFKIRIMTITGKVVREITTNELGPINIGRNITQYAWDGKDEFGDQLANGVYLYTVYAYINGQDIEHRNSGADKFFKKNYGKMFLMR